MYDGDVELFYKILMGEISEHYYYDQVAMVAHLKKLLEEMDVCDGKRDGLIQKAVFFAGLREVFPCKPERSIQILIEIVFRNDITNGQIDINKLLIENEDGDQSEFMECVRDQYLQVSFTRCVLLRAREQGQIIYLMTRWVD